MKRLFRCLVNWAFYLLSPVWILPILVADLITCQKGSSTRRMLGGKTFFWEEMS